MHIVIVSKEMLPIGTHFCIPEDIRIWGIGEGLREHGCTVSYLVPENNYGAKSRQKCTHRVYQYTPANLNSLIVSLKPDVIMAQNWQVAEQINLKHIPLIIDLAGGASDGADNRFDLPLTGQIRKMKALQKADQFICSSEEQKWFYLNWLMQGGFDISSDIIRVVPATYPSAYIPARRKNSKSTCPKPIFISYWDEARKPEFGIVAALIDVMSSKRKGYYTVLSSGATYEYDLENFLVLYNELSLNQDHFAVAELFSWKELRDEYMHADVAVYLAEKSLETQMHIPDRALQYLCAGLPVLCAKGTKLASIIEKYHAGWTVDFSDIEDVKATVASLVYSPQAIELARQGVRKLLAETVRSPRNLDSLLEYCRNARKTVRSGDGLIGHLLDFSKNVINIQNPLLNDIYIENILVMVSGSWTHLADCLELVDIMFPLSNVTLLCPDYMLLEDMEITADCELVIYEHDQFSADNVTTALMNNDTERFDLGIALFDDQYIEGNSELKAALLASGAKYKVGFTADHNFVLLEDSIEKCIVEVLDEISQTSQSINP